MEKKGEEEVTLDEAIEFHKKEWDMLRTAAARCDMTDPVESKMAYNDIKAAKRHGQYASWFEELKERRENDKIRQHCGRLNQIHQ